MNLWGCEHKTLERRNTADEESEIVRGAQTTENWESKTKPRRAAAAGRENASDVSPLGEEKLDAAFERLDVDLFLLLGPVKAEQRSAHPAAGYKHTGTYTEKAKAKHQKPSRRELRPSSIPMPDAVRSNDQLAQQAYCTDVLHAFGARWHVAVHPPNEVARVASAPTGAVDARTEVFARHWADFLLLRGSNKVKRVTRDRNEPEVGKQKPAPTEFVAHMHALKEKTCAKGNGLCVYLRHASPSPALIEVGLKALKERFGADAGH
jgi:hypothetical protein